MPKASVTKWKQNTFASVKFSTEFHELDFTDCGAGLAVMAPEWDGFALILTREDLTKLKVLVDGVLDRV